MKKLLALMVAALFGCPLFATTWYVDGTSGSDSYSGMSLSQAKKTIQAAIDSAADGDTIRVTTGVYAPIDTKDKSLTICSQDGADKTIIDGVESQRCAGLGGRTWAEEEGDEREMFSTLVGFTLRNGADGAYWSASEGAAVRGGMIKGCIITGCNALGAVVYACEAHDCLVRKNDASSAMAVMMHGRAYNCTIVDNEGDAAWDNGLVNSVLFENSGDVYISSGNGCAYPTNCVLQSSLSCGFGNKVGDPKFVDAANGDYHLAVGSSCIDAGDNSYVTSETDLDGNARVVNGKVDIGCYEYGAGTIARTWYVNGTSGSDSYSGLSSSQAKKTIQAAIDASSDGDTIRVAPGTYAPIVSARKLIAITGSGAGNTVIDGGGETCCADLKCGYVGDIDLSFTNTTLVGFTLQNGNGGGVAGGTVRECVVKGCRNGSGCGHCVVENSLIIDNSAINGGGVIGGVVRNCTVVGNYASDNGGGVYDSAIVNSIVWNNTSDWDWGENGGNIYNGASASDELWKQMGQPEEIGACVEDPNFVDMANGDYHLAAGSPCIDAGDNSYVASEVDLDGNSRIVNGKVDIGCYEYGADAIGKFWVTQYSFEDSPWSIDEALLMIEDPSSWSTQPISGTYPVIAFSDSDGHAEDFEFNRFPGNPNGKAPDGFAVVSHGKLYVGEPGTYTFCCGSDDGFRCVISSAENSYSFEYAGTRNYGRTFKTISFSKTGVYDLDLTHFSYGGGVLFLSVAKGTYSSFDLSAFKLVGDPASGITLVDSEGPTTCVVSFDANGGSCGTSSCTISRGGAYGSLPAATRTGYEFLGWFTAAVGGTQVTAATVVTGDVTYYAHWTPIRYAIMYVNTMGAANPNPTSYTIEDAVTFAALPDVDGRWFVGWSFPGISQGTIGDLTVSANWESTTPSVVPDVDDDEPMDAGVATTYDGIIMDADGLPVGYISVKAAKASGKGAVRTSKVTATIQMAGEAKKVMVKGNVNVSEAMFVQSASDGRVLDMIFTRDSIFGVFDGYEIEGVRNFLASTAKSDRDLEAKQRAEAIYNRLKDNYVMAYSDEAGWNGLSLSVMTKGKVKVSGVLADGTKVSTSTQMIVGEDYSCIPVIYTKKDVSLAFSIYFSNDGDESFVFGYYDAVISRVSALCGESAFCMDGDLYDLFADAGYELIEDFLPWEVSVAPDGTKWIVADGAKAGKIKMDRDGYVYDSKESDNPSGLKLTFTAKTGLFKGSFKVYAIDENGKLKTFSATVNGIVVDGFGYGTATIKKIGSCPVIIVP